MHRVDAPDHLYVTDDYIVTHNTVMVMLHCPRDAIAADRPGQYSLFAHRVHPAGHTIRPLGRGGVSRAFDSRAIHHAHHDEQRRAARRR